MRLLLASALILTLAAGATAKAPPFQQVRGVIHLDSTVSGGEYDPEEMVRFLIENDLQVAIFTDQATVRVEYGTFPARNIMGWVTGLVIGRALNRTGSVGAYGPRKYVKDLNTLDGKYSQILVIPGVEAFPFYYWEGSPLKGSLTLVNGYKHLLAFGMETPEDYAGLPTVGEGFFRGYSIETFLSLWPLVLLTFGAKCFRQARSARWPALYRIPAFLFFAVGLLFLLHNFPYKVGRYDQYSGDQGLAPYQDFIDYVVGRNGVVFFAHPEVSSEVTHRIGPLRAHIRTEAPYSDLLTLRNYTGFAAFYEGMKYVIPPGGIWDQVLAQYCTGLRERPVWAIAEGDVEGAQFSPKLSQTVFLVKERSREEILQSLKEGRIYALAGPLAEHLTLTDFTLSSGGQTARTGETLNAESGVLNLAAALECKSNPRGTSLKADLIRDGQIVRTFKGNGRLDIVYADSAAADGYTHYYRLDVRAPKQTRLLSNPIFVRPGGAS